MDAAPATTRPVWLGAAAVATVSLALGLITLGSKALWFDEAYNGSHIAGPWNGVITIIRHTEMSQGAYLLGLKAWAAVAPNTEVGLRLPSVVFAALAAGLLVPLGSRLCDRPTGIVAGLLLATNAFLLRHAQEARTYALVTLAVVVATLLFVKAIDDPRRRAWLLYAVAAAAAVYCHFYGGFVIVAHAVSLPFAPTRPPRRRVIEAGGLFLLLIAPALYFTAVASRSQLGWLDDPSLRLVLRVFDNDTGRNMLLAGAAIVGLVLVALQARRGAGEERFRFVLLAGWCILPVALGFLASLIQPILIARYAIVIAPALALVAAVTVTAALRRNRVLALSFLVALLAVSGYRIAQWYGKETDDWRGAVAFVNREKRPGDAVVVAPFWAGDAYRYYDTKQPLDEIATDGRTLMVVYADPRERGDLADQRVEQSVLTLTGEKQFGPSVFVRVYEPRR